MSESDVAITQISRLFQALAYWVKDGCTVMVQHAKTYEIAIVIFRHPVSSNDRYKVSTVSTKVFDFNLRTHRPCLFCLQSWKCGHAGAVMFQYNEIMSAALFLARGETSLPVKL